jgi:hypothetical protein
VLTCKNNGKSVSDVLNIDGDYERFCLDEAADYVYFALKNNVKPPESGNNILNKHAKKR